MRYFMVLAQLMIQISNFKIIFKNYSTQNYKANLIILSFISPYSILQSRRRLNIRNQDHFTKIEQINYFFNDYSFNNISHYNIAPCFIFEASYFYHKNISSFEIIFDSIVQTIPPYGTYPLRWSFKVIKSLYLLVYSNDTEKIYAIYDLAAVHYKLADPLIMKGGINLSHELPTSLAFNLTTIQDGGLFYDLIDGGINNYQVVGQAYLNCVMKEKYNKTIKLLAYNSFNNGTTVITIYTTIDEWNKNQLYISLILFLAGFILIASFLCWYYTRGKQISDNFIEELELE